MLSMQKSEYCMYKTNLERMICNRCKIIQFAENRLSSEAKMRKALWDVDNKQSVSCPYADIISVYQLELDHVH